MKQRAGLRTLILDVIDPSLEERDARGRIVELERLIDTVGGILIEKIIQKRGRPSADTFLGNGKIREASVFARENDIDLVILNGFLRPNQVVQLQNMFPQKMLWDRTDLILNIFDRHACSQLAQLQIKLARLQHDIPRIYARQATTLFERAGAGIGTRGAGEKGIEQEKRHIRNLIKQLEDKIKIVQKTHNAQRKHRNKIGLRMVALVGYTNAGKSSLMKILTKKESVRAHDSLFTTLDTKIGKAFLPKNNEEILVADTIGFLQDLPPNLISSFLTTLEEAQNADILLHVIDISDPDFRKKIRVVEDILSQIGCDHIPKIYIANKLDLAPDFSFEGFREEFSLYSPLFISCLKNQGILELKNFLSEYSVTSLTPT